jgi:hypothetical protein
MKITREEAEQKYPKGYHKVSFQDWLSLGDLFAPAVSPGSVVSRLGVTRAGVLHLARQGKLRYFVSVRPWGKRGYVLIPEKDIDELVEERKKTALQC